VAKRKKSNAWDAVFARVRAHYHLGKVYDRPTAVEFDCVESELGIRFPSSYQVFAERFGLGGDLMWIRRVFPLTGESSVLKISRDDRRSEPEEWGLELASFPRELFARVVALGWDGGVCHYAFDPTDITDSESGECRIYALPYSPYYGEIRPIADSFPAFLDWVRENCNFDDEEDEVLTESEVIKCERLGPETIEYAPFWSRERQQPAEDEVKLWLASNNNTVRDLARSIRDGYPEAFPVLADALEEAGCKSSDLINSCRKGDPDIDGAWVLTVLLGQR
jgi:hypothetical protein